MKKKLQKYLSGSNEGFSLVELIIVIAIMAILIGVVALAVIPYLEKSRESKDLQALSSLSNALSTAVADTKVTSTGSFVVHDGATLSTTKTGDAGKIEKAMAESLGGAAIDVSSAGANDCDITCFFDPANNVVAVYVATGQTNQGDQPSNLANPAPTINGQTVQCCKYNDNAPLMVSNGGNATATGGTGGTP